MNYIFPKLKTAYRNDQLITNNLLMLINKLKEQSNLEKGEFLFILNNITKKEIPYLNQAAYEIKYQYYQNRVYLRGLIEISNYCKMGCKYCGINSKNKQLKRYRMTIKEIIECCLLGYSLGYKTFVIQGGEDNYYTDELLVEMVKKIKEKMPDVRITLSLGERSKASYQKLFDAGTDRYLLRHETASRRLYEYLHPRFMSFDNRRECLKNLKAIGYQVGAGFMVGSPTQTNEDLVEDLIYLKALAPEMVGIGPYLCHEDTELKGNISGSLEETLVMVALVRLILPKALIPATTALGSLAFLGREKALKTGANVMMPNISPTENRELYEIYQNKICITEATKHCRNCIEGRILAANHVVDLRVGDYIDIERMNLND